MRLVLTFVFALVLHLAFGWAATPLAAFVGGYAAGGKGGRLGAAALVLSWGALVVFAFFAGGAAFGRMSDLLAGILGGLPGVVAVVLALVVAAALGALGGIAGAATRQVTGEQAVIANQTI